MPKDPCQPIRNDIAAVEEEIQSLETVIEEVPPSLKPHFAAIIKREKIHLMRLKRALSSCERGR